MWLGELVASHISYALAQPRQIASLRAHNAPDKVYVHVDVWSPADSIADDSTAAAA